MNKTKIKDVLEWMSEAITDDKDVVEQYYQARELVRPNALEALMWAVSELGELAAAMLAEREEFKIENHEQLYMLIKLTEIKEIADTLMSKDGKPWVRNSEGAKKSVPHEELGDLHMMLTMFGIEAFGMTPSEAMKAKMIRKLKEMV